MQTHRSEWRFEQVPLESIAALRRSEDPPKILNVSSVPLLLQTRSAILKTAGLLAVNTGSTAEAVRLCRRQAFDAVVLCHALSRPQKQQVMQAARRSQTRTRVIGLYNVARTEAAGADVAVDSHDGPEALLKAVRAAF